jgi:hypothetical protein
MTHWEVISMETHIKAVMYCRPTYNYTLWRGFLYHVILKLTVQFHYNKHRLNTKSLVRFQVLTATSMKIAVFWDVPLKSLVESDWCFRGAYCLHHRGDHSPHQPLLSLPATQMIIALMMEAVNTSETSVTTYQTTRRNVPWDSHLHTRRCDNLKSQM